MHSNKILSFLCSLSLIRNLSVWSLTLRLVSKTYKD